MYVIYPYLDLQMHEFTVLGEPIIPDGDFFFHNTFAVFLIHTLTIQKPYYPHTKESNKQESVKLF